MESVKKTAVILFNLGGPDSRGAIAPFLFNFFMDKNIIRLPLPARWILAKLISFRRSRKQANDSYAYLGYKSPLLENTKVQADALEEVLGTEYKVFVCMRYWHPVADEVAKSVKLYDPDRIVLLPLYPQYSTTTTKSSFEDWARAARKEGLSAQTEKIESYPENEGFIKASARNIEKIYETMETPPRILFSAHGLPEDIIKAGDPYQAQGEKTVQAILKELSIENPDFRICYQSRVGPKKWIGPSVEEALEEAAKDNVPVLIYPHAFVSEHVETLVELDIEYKALSERMGIPFFARAQTVGCAPEFIEGLAGLVRKPLS